MMMRLRETKRTKTGEEEVAVAPIHYLTDDQLVHIISYLGMKDAVGTSILSKRWRFLWTCNPQQKLWFSLAQKPSKLEAEGEAVNGIVHQYLKHCPNPNRLGVCIILPKRFSKARENVIKHMPFHVDNWISLAISRNVHNLSFEIYNTTTLFVYIVLALSIYDHTTMAKLSLSRFIINPPPMDFKGFPSLTILKLHMVQITDQTVETLVLTCPLLEILLLSHIDTLVNLNVSSAPKLRTLYVLNCSKMIDLLVDAPNLLTFIFKDSYSVRRTNLLFNNVSSLSKAIVHFDDPLFTDYKLFFTEYKPLVTHLAHVNCIEASTWFSQFVFVEYYVLRTPHIIFKNLKDFGWCGCLDRTYNVLAIATFLGDCPKLERLYIRNSSRKEILERQTPISELHNHYYHLLKDSIPPPSDEPPTWLDDKHYLQHLNYELPHLKTIELIDMSGTKMEMDLVRFLLRKANVLDSLILTSRSNKNLKLQKKISSFQKASAHAQLVLSKDPSLETDALQVLQFPYV